MVRQLGSCEGIEIWRNLMGWIRWLESPLLDRQLANYAVDSDCCKLGR